MGLELLLKTLRGEEIDWASVQDELNIAKEMKRVNDSIQRALRVDNIKGAATDRGRGRKRGAIELGSNSTNTRNNG